MLYSIESGKTVPLTIDRYNSFSADWSPDSKWIYFLSDRSLSTVVKSPWGDRQLQDGDVILSLNGRSLDTRTDPGDLLRGQAGKQVLLHVLPKGKSEVRDVIGPGVGKFG